MKQIATIIFFSLFLIACNNQANTTDYSKTINEQAEIMGQFLLKKDFNSFANFTYPKVSEMMGGKQKMVEIMEQGSREMEAEGMGFSNITLGEPTEIIREKDELQCTLPQTIEMKVPDGRLITQSTLIAISIDNGKNWYFLDTPGKDIQTMKSMLPNLSEKLIIPTQQKPTFYKD